ncbi:ABC transporter permease [Eoetvoesiella caeni]|uniref:Transport permease protein n=1 Tax=Eoetvoesiella caeni TaxID=645616 RepID=A0A366H1D2_9BURK|nr:ABC transporter permease [Eoetvoesiella caeni]MCI2810922.1 ABC transporter permease [Eoetvoesiella caeni]NYT56779.1 ABC transporter permease [Eoetvoesiella caeni]RBP35578.1 ABC-2 type transport system permease protein [Eoetvoesiella caeni]
MSHLSSAFSFTRLRAQIIKEVLSILRDPRSRMVVFVPPLLQLLVFAFAATLEVRNVDIAVHNQDAGRWSHELVTRLDRAEFINQIHHVANNQELRSLIDRSKVIAALDIPMDFSRAIAAGDSGQVQVLIDGRRSNSGQITVSYLSAIAAEVGAQINPEIMPAAPLVVRNWFNPNLIYRWFIVPGLSGILALFSALLITSLSIARERELGTFDQLLVSPTSTPEIIISKSLPALAIGTMLGLMMIAAAIVLFQIPFSGSFWLLLMSLVLFILSVVGIGLMISAISATQQQAILGGFAIGVPAVLMSGFATPVENMPTLLQWLAQAIPLTHFLIIVQGSFLKALPLGDILASLWPLAIIALVSLTMATVFVRERLQ